MVAILVTQATVLEGYLLGGAAALVSLYGLWFFEFKKKHVIRSRLFLALSHHEH